MANIKIGMLASMTGDKAQQGQYASNSAKMAIEEINAAGGILGRKVEIVTEDDLGTDAGAVNAFNKLASDANIIAMVGPGYSTSCLAIDASVKKAQILTTAQGSNNKLGFLGNPWMYQMRTSDDVQVAVGIKYAVEKLGLNSDKINYRQVSTYLVLKFIKDELVMSQTFNYQFMTNEAMKR